ncbi:MAG: hypothetical protein RLZZ338_1106 [Cyanobacteriota bacterium]|jgi:formylglycine-generating enzyme required for sulfatase activity/uncharacterized protein with von Willebrand factor type A (vWA) domain
MTPNDPHLVQFFLNLKTSDLPLQFDDYKLLQKAWSLESLRPKDYPQLKKLCQQLWGKTKEEQEKIGRAFDEKLTPHLATEIQENLTQKLSKTSTSSPTTKPDLPTQTQSQNQTNPNLSIEQTIDMEVGIAVPQSTTAKPNTSQQTFILNDEYFPLTRAQLIKGSRSLRTSLRGGHDSEREIDFDATIKRICQENIAEFVYRPSRVNQAELLLLIDQSDSMTPFHLIAERLRETAITSKAFKSLKIRYFRNSPKDALFQDPDLLKKQPLDQILPKLHPTRTRVLIFSDAGATTPIINEVRIKLIENFLSQLKTTVRQIVWLNPLPKEDWLGTTALISSLVPMFPFSVLGWRELWQNLRGQPVTTTTLTELPLEIPIDDDSLYCLDEVLDDEKDKEQYHDAIETLSKFTDDFPGYCNLAYHGAFPLAITPHLLYYLRENFLQELPWITVPDLLFSPLFQSIGGKLYQMDSTVRHLLLKALKNRFGNERLKQLSDALLFYLDQGLTESLVEAEDLGENPEWIALGYTQPNELAKQLALKLQQSFQGKKEDKIKTASLTATFAEPLAEAKFEPLLKLARGLARQARGYEDGAQEIFKQLQPELNIEGVSLIVPLKTFTFETVTVNKKGEIIQREIKEALYFTEDLGNEVTFDMVYIPGGTFLMGSPETEAESRDNEKPQHQVTIQPFFMGKYTATQAQWKAVAQLPKIERDLAPDPSYFKGDNRPVEGVSWLDAVEFCARLSQKTLKNYRLPSEAEWEYACRAGTETPFHFGETITSELANYQAEDEKIRETLYKGTYGEEPAGEYRKETTPVGSFPFANNFGLYDMHGNVWEWCADPWHSNYNGAPTDGRVWDEKNNNPDQKSVDLLIISGNDDRDRLLRGGSWYNPPRNSRSAIRYHLTPLTRDYGNGFRFVCVWLRGLNSP